MLIRITNKSDLKKGRLILMTTNNSINLSTSVNSSVNNILNGTINLSNISVEQLQQLLRLVQTDKPIVISMGKLNMINNTTAECIHCHKPINVLELNEQDKQAAINTGLCKDCQNILAQASLISKTQRINSTPVVSTIDSALPRTTRSTISAGQRCRDILFQAIPNMSIEHINMFCDADKSKELLGILYPLFVKVTGFSADQIDAARKPKGFNRYNIKPCHIFDDDYLICNDLYDRHIARFQNAFVKLGLIQGEIIEMPTKRKKHKDMPEAPVCLWTKEKTTDKKSSTISTVEMTPSNTDDTVISPVRHKKKTREELMADVLQIEATNEENKQQRLAKLKQQFNVSFGKPKIKDNTLMNATVNL